MGRTGIFGTVDHKELMPQRRTGDRKHPRELTATQYSDGGHGQSLRGSG